MYHYTTNTLNRDFLTLILKALSSWHSTKHKKINGHNV